MAVILFALLAGIGVIAAFSVVSVYAALSNGLPPVSQLENLTLPQEIVVLDRTGKTELARFGEFKREVVAFEDIPPILVDATTAIEDKTFWENAGFDPTAIVAAGIDSLRGSSRGASTITQQLVRARLLDPDLVQDPDRTVERKLKEIIQSIRLTKAYPDVAGKQRIIAAYLNNNYYGNQSYGVKAAARSYFGKELKDLTPGEAAILAALPQSPSNYDLVRNAISSCDVELDEEDRCPEPAKNEHLTLDPETKIAQRRDAVLDLMAQGRTPLSDASPAELEAEKGKPLELARQTAPRWRAPHFVWTVQAELARVICGPDTPTCQRLSEGGLRVTTTLDWRLQQIAEKWVKAAAIAPRNRDPEGYAKRLGFDEYQAWMRKLEDKNVRNGALVAMDYETGDIVAHVGSANYYATSNNPKFQPQFDVLTQGYRQPGSAFKPFNYVVGIDEGTFTAGEMFMDVATDFGGGYTPSDADNLERGPVRMRDALQFS
ncbi:MAG TPA: transglycosylase domain-containing protein, partial [Candidatus Limnocylindrales bacterium]